MAKSALRWVFAALVAAVVFGVSGCGGKSPLAPDPGTTPAGTGNLPSAKDLTVVTVPGANAELKAGSSASVTISAKGYSNGTLHFGLVFRRDDGLEKSPLCAAATAVSPTIHWDVAIPMLDSFWAGDHTFDAVGVVYFSTEVQDPRNASCPFLADSSMDWSKVTDKVDVPLRWHLKRQEFQAMDDSYTMERGKPLTIDAPGLMVNDLIPDGGNPFTLFEGPGLNLKNMGGAGGFVLDMSGNPAFVGQVSFKYQLRASGLESNWATVNITVK